MKNKHKINKNRVIILAILLVCCSAILAGASTVEKVFIDQANGYHQAQAVLEEGLRPQQMKEDYQTALTKIITEYNAGKLSDKDLETKVLALRVPAEYKALHLKVVGATEKMLEPDKGKAEAKKQWEDLQKNYWWLATSLASMIANIY
jgi:Na+-transporting NADH:ubiquinone oxidoreductase subunit NqrC